MTETSQSYVPTAPRKAEQGFRASIALAFIFVGLPIFDMINGFVIVRGFLPENSLASPSQIGRLLAAFLIFYAVRKIELSPVVMFCFAVLTVLELSASFRSNNSIGFVFGLVTIFRFFYSYLLILLFKKALETDPDTLVRFLKLNIDLVCGSIIFAFLTGLGNSTYGWGFGTKGFFASGNGLGIYIGVAAICLFALKKYGYSNRPNLITAALAIVALLLIGSKTALLLAIVFLSFFCWTSKFRLLWGSLVVGALLYSWSELLSLGRLLFDVVIIRFQHSENLLAFLTSSRIGYIESAFAEIGRQDSSFLRWLFGGGSYLSFQNPAADYGFDTLETDPFDIFFMYGLFGVTLYSLVILAGLVSLTRLPLFLVGLILLTLHSFIAGHVLLNAMSTTIFAVYFAIGAAAPTKNSTQLRTLGDQR